MNTLKTRLISYLLGDEVESVLLKQKVELESYKNLIRQQDEIQDQLRLQIAMITKPTIPTVGFDDTHVEPQDTKSRRQYCADVKVFYDNILNSKIKNAVAETRHLLSNVRMDENMPSHMTRSEYDYFVRGMEAGFWAINDWAIHLSGELQENNYEIND